MAVGSWETCRLRSLRQNDLFHMQIPGPLRNQGIRGLVIGHGSTLTEVYVVAKVLVRPGLPDHCIWLEEFQAELLVSELYVLHWIG